ncbi:MAG TPA: hypothetical protein VHZ96_06555 [Frankiaceae bacterium]|jgi:hypothetical protein|nr:hypothetical protein [Frankiaceae bacterium]
MQHRFPESEADEQPAAAALLHLQCELSPELRPMIARWWEDFHHAELLTLPGFLWARRGQLIAPDGHAPIAAMYGITSPSAADQPRPPEFTLMPSELDSKVTFHRRIMQRTSELPGATEPIGTAFLQLLRPVSERGRQLDVAIEQMRGWSGALSVSGWRSVVNAPDTSRQEVIHLRETELILAELTGDDREVLTLLARAADELPGWEISAYRQAFPARGVLLPVPR